MICPGFGNDSIDYVTPLSQPRETYGFVSTFERRGFISNNNHIVPIKRIDWVRVAGGLFDMPRFYNGNALPTGLGYGWYVKRLKDKIDKAYTESGGSARSITKVQRLSGW